MRLNSPLQFEEVTAAVENTNEVVENIYMHLHFEDEHSPKNSAVMEKFITDLSILLLTDKIQDKIQEHNGYFGIVERIRKKISTFKLSSMKY